MFCLKYSKAEELLIDLKCMHRDKMELEAELKWCLINCMKKIWNNSHYDMQIFCKSSEYTYQALCHLLKHLSNFYLLAITFLFLRFS